MAQVRDGRAITLRDVAKAAGVDTSTASRILRDDQSKAVRVETRERVRRVAAQLGYEPNAAARTLRTRRTNTLALLLPDMIRVGRTDVVGRTELVQGVAAASAEAGQLMVLAQAPDPMDASIAPSRFALRGRVDGILIAFANVEDAAFGNAWDANTPVVFVNRWAEGRFGSVVMDDEAGAALAVEHLVELGHTRIAHISGAIATDTAQRRELGFLRAIASHGLTVHERWIINGRYSEEGGREAAAELVRRFEGVDDPPTGLVVANLMSALGTLQVFRENGVSVPDDISVVSIDEHLITAHTDPPLTTIRMPLRQLGFEATKMLLGAIAGQQLHRRIVEQPPELIRRMSTSTPR